MTDHSALRARALLTLQQALLGEVRPEMRAVLVSLRLGEVLVTVVTDRAPTDAERESFDASAMTVLVAASPFPGDWRPHIRHAFVVVPEGEPIHVDGAYAFLRWEAASNEGIFTAEEQREIDAAERSVGRTTRPTSG